MADNKIQGTAKKFDGTAIDYVSIFNWGDGKCIAQVVPDALGAWQYTYSKNLEVGLTYVADGCEPITHGAYNFEYVHNPLLETILHYDFNGNVLDKSANALNGVKTGNTTFVTGRKAGTQALKFIAGCVKTPLPLPINSDKLTVSFWISTSQTDTGVIYESSNDPSNQNTFGSYLNERGANTLTVTALQRSDSVNTQVVYSDMDFNNTYQHVIIEIDRSRDGANEQKIYINNTLTSLNVTGFSPNLSGNLQNYVLYIGQRAASQFPLKAKLQDMRVYNRVLTANERLALFNE